MSKEIKTRSEICESDKWDLSSLFPCQEAWESDFQCLSKKIQEAKQFKGTLGKSPEHLLVALKWKSDTLMLLEQLGNYAFLCYAAEAMNTDNQRRMGLYSQLESQLQGAISFFDPEIQTITNLPKWIESKDFADYKIYLTKLMRFKEHILSESEEAVLAKEAELQDTPSKTFEVLTNVDMDFGRVNSEQLTQSTYSSFMINPNREIRKQAYDQFYETFEKHQQTIACLYSGSVKQDIFNAKIRGFDSAIQASLYGDNVPLNVYTGLIDSVHKAFPSLHKYYDLKRRRLGLDRLAHWDVYVPLVGSVQTHTTYEEATEIVKSALAPLGKDYVSVIGKGITSDRWVDRYENKGKRSGAFSSGAFKGNPYILLNYKEDVLRDVFTLAHEGGHSMHSYYSKRNNPFSCYDYTIFEAEVASTFNEQLVAKYLIDTAKDDQVKANIICKQMDDVVATLFRQTMFAEFELLAHTQVEQGEPLTVDSLRKTYKSLLEAYFGPDVEFTKNSDLEGLRIPHFYRAYYVYKYSTGISASIALSERVLNGGQKELDDYLNFLKSGGSKFPIDSLKAAGVDMSTSKPIEMAVKKFDNLMEQFESLMK